MYFKYQYNLILVFSYWGSKFPSDTLQLGDHQEDSEDIDDDEMSLNEIKAKDMQKRISSNTKNTKLKKIVDSG